MTDLHNEKEIEKLFEHAEEDDDLHDVEVLGEGAAQAIKIPGTGDKSRKKSTVIKKPSGTDDTGGKKKRVLPKTGGGTDERKKRKA
jgi:hypothetical protein